MQRSRDRILTTHTGSLPRPPALVELYVRKGRGEAVDAALAAGWPCGNGGCRAPSA